jgi:hypothetical protein
MVSPDSLGTACPLSGRNSTYRPVQISETSSELRILKGLKTGEPLSYSFKYANIGREPALKAVIQSYPGTIEPRPPNDLWYVRFPGRNETCETARPNDRGLVIYPSNTQKNEITYTSTEPPPDSEAVLKGDKVLVIEGCIGYVTFGDRMRMSSTCTSSRAARILLNS